MKQLLPSVGASASALLTSSATLVCCVLPAVMVSLGAGATLAYPQLIWLSERKGMVFGLAGFMLIVSGVLLWNARRLSCPVDPAAARLCTRLRRISHVLFALATLGYLTGVIFAFVLA
jgi:uncharacterized iron-regulated membrane protein